MKKYTKISFLAFLFCAFTASQVQAATTAKCDEEREMIQYDREVSESYQKCSVQDDFITADAALADFVDTVLDDDDHKSELLMNRALHFQNEKERSSCAFVWKTTQSINDYRKKHAIFRFVAALNRAPKSCPGAKKSPKIEEGLVADPDKLSDYTDAMVGVLEGGYASKLAECNDALKTAKKRAKDDWEQYCVSNPASKPSGYLCRTKEEMESRQQDFARILRPLRKINFDVKFDISKMIDNFRAVRKAVDANSGSTSCRERIVRAAVKHQNREIAIAQKGHFEGLNADDQPKSHSRGGSTEAP